MNYSDQNKRKKFKSANPVFEEWLSELKEDAIAKDLQSKHTFSKCLNSLRKYPLPLKSGKECVILEGFGDKICKLIDEKLEVYLKDGGKLHQDEDIEILDECENDIQYEQELMKSKTKKNMKKINNIVDDETRNNCSDLDSIRSKYPNLLKSSNAKERVGKTKSWDRNSSDEEQVLAEPIKKAKKNSRTKEYVPEFRSGAYALLITLLKNEDEKEKNDKYMLKSQLINEAQKHSDAQFTSHDPKNHYTAWNSMSNLIKKNFVFKENKLPARYSLTESGRQLAKKLLYGSSTNNEIEDKSESDNEISQKKSTESNDEDECVEIGHSEKISKQDPNCYLIDSSDSEKLDEDIGCSTGLSQQFLESKITEFPISKSISNLNIIHSKLPCPDVLFTLLPGSYDLILFIDNCETNSKKQDLLIDEIKKSGIKHEFGKLNVGDFTWIARPRNGQQMDLVLDYIVERKRMDDFCSSIIDGRYKEQKFRLKKSGITHLVYLIEEYGSMKHMSLPEKSLIQANVNTQIIDKLVVHHSTDPKDSAFYLIQMSKFLIEKFNLKKLCATKKNDLDNFEPKNSANLDLVYLMTFKEFNEFSNKNKPLSIKEMFAKCLMKIQGLSQDKVLAIIDLYPTPAHLINEYSKCSDENGRIKLLANIKYGSQQRNIGPAVSKIIAQLFFTNAPLP